MSFSFYLLATVPLVAMVGFAMFRRPAHGAESVAPPDRAADVAGSVVVETPRKAS